MTLTDAQLANALAEEAGKRLLEARETLRTMDADTWLAKDVGDAVAQQYLNEALSEHRPNDAILSEEALDDDRRLTAERVWIIDPLDGTQEFSEFERNDWAVHVALWERRDEAGNPSDEGRLVAGAVALPGFGITLSTDQPPATPERKDRNPVIVVSRNRVTREVIAVAERLGCDVARLGSAGAKTMAVVLGEADLYVHSGGMYQWDSAAPIAVAHAAGLHTSRLDGSPLVYNRADTWLPDLIVCQQHLAQPVIEALRGGRLNG